MEVRKGYKQTEVGIIPEDWDVTFVGEEFSIQLGKMLDIEKNVGIPKSFLGNRSVQWGRIDLSDIGVIKLTPSDLQRYRLRNGDLLVCEGGEVGRAAIWNQPIEECYYQKALHRLRPKHGYNTVLMINILQHLASKGFLLNYVTQTSIAHLPKDKFETVPIILPPLAEQEAIAEALSDADAYIEALEQLLAKKRQVKQGAMSELLTGKRRLMDSGEWKVKRLGDVLTLRYGKGQKDIIVNGGKFPIIATSGEVGRTNQYLYDKPSVIIGRKGTIDKPQYIDTPFWTIDTAYYSEISEQANPKFLFYLLTTIDWYSYNEASGVPSLNAKTVENIEINLPPLPEQTAIAEILSEMDEELSALAGKLLKARQVKAGMMSELLTGKIRLV